MIARSHTYVHNVDVIVIARISLVYLIENFTICCPHGRSARIFGARKLTNLLNSFQLYPNSTAQRMIGDNKPIDFE